MWTHAVFIAALLAPDQSAPAAPRDPRKQPLTIEDALFTISDVTGRILPVRDADGDGIGDLLISRFGGREAPGRIDLVSSKHGALIRTMWPIRGSTATAAAWDASGDADGDGVSDLIVGLPQEEQGQGKIIVISGKTDETLLTLSGADANDRFGAAVVFVGDLDGDHRDEFVVGASQSDPTFPLVDRPLDPYHSQQDHLVFTDGTNVKTREYWQSRMAARSSRPGYVSLRRAKDGSEIWRADSALAGHGFGVHVAVAGDVARAGGLDLLVQCDLKSDQPVVVLSGKSGRTLFEMKHRGGWIGAASDLDADGTPDFFADELDTDLVHRGTRVQCISGSTHELLFELLYPDCMSPYGVTVAMGDLDADGCADLALGEANFNIKGKNDHGMKSREIVDLRKLTLAQAVAMESEAWNAFTWESGCALVYSGRTHKVIFGVFGLPGSRRGIGLEVAPLPDVNGDGHPDVIVADEGRAYVFAGPGPEPK